MPEAGSKCTGKKLHGITSSSAIKLVDDMPSLMFNAPPPQNMKLALPKDVFIPVYASASPPLHITAIST